MSSTSSDEEFDRRSVISKRSRGAAAVHPCPHSGCDKFFSRPSRLKTHLLSHTGERPHKCTFKDCEKDFTRRAHLVRHVNNCHKEGKEKKVHQSSLDRIPCEDCDATFANKHSLKKHWRKCHDPDNDAIKTYPCDVCDQTFSRRQSLKSHRQEKHPELERPHACQTCDKRFLYPKKLKEHEKLHKGHECEICKSNFRKWTAFRQHMARQHPKKYVCEVCSKEFPSRYRLKPHMLTHADERSMFHCTYANCPRFYYYESNLTSHIQAYHEGLRFICAYEGCEARFKFRSAKKKHFRIVHANESLPKIQKEKGPRRPRKDKGFAKTSTAVELSGIQVESEEEKDLIFKSGQVTLTSEALSKEVENIPSDALDAPDDLSTTSAHEEDNNDSSNIFKNPSELVSQIIPDVFIPLRRSIILSDMEEDEDISEKELSEHSEPSPAKVKKYDFSAFVAK